MVFFEIYIQRWALVYAGELWNIIWWYAQCHPFYDVCAVEVFFLLKIIIKKKFLKVMRYASWIIWKWIGCTKKCNMDYGRRISQLSSSIEWCFSWIWIQFIFYYHFNELNSKGFKLFKNLRELIRKNAFLMIITSTAFSVSFFLCCREEIDFNFICFLWYHFQHLLDLFGLPFYIQSVLF